MKFYNTCESDLQFTLPIIPITFLIHIPTPLCVIIENPRGPHSTTLARFLPLRGAILQDRGSAWPRGREAARGDGKGRGLRDCGRKKLNLQSIPRQSPLAALGWAGHAASSAAHVEEFGAARESGGWRGGQPRAGQGPARRLFADRGLHPQRPQMRCFQTLTLLLPSRTGPDRTLAGTASTKYSQCCALAVPWLCPAEFKLRSQTGGRAATTSRRHAESRVGNPQRSNLIAGYEFPAPPSMASVRYGPWPGGMGKERGEGLLLAGVSQTVFKCR